MRGNISYRSCDVETVQDAGGLGNTDGKDNGGECWKKGYIYSCYFDCCVQNYVSVTEYTMAQLVSRTTTRHRRDEKP